MKKIWNTLHSIMGQVKENLLKNTLRTIAVGEIIKSVLAVLNMRSIAMDIGHQDTEIE